MGNVWRLRLPTVVSPLQSNASNVKEEDSITDVENAVFDLGVMDSLCFLFIDQRVLIGMITKFIKFIELNFSVITRGFDIKVGMLKGPLWGRPKVLHLINPTKKAGFRHCPSQNSFQPRLDTFNYPLVVDDNAVRDE
ncbi:hypothetical protein Tco_0858783 [Tanacetum coccineum]|uniref:Uncharacterized protein n=1 Tax=Tanacetum coccineum TaxID=301880 RepID=A0ABQ5BAU9_9ASTR